MKKILSVAAAITLAAALISCGDSTSDYSGATDTVIGLSTPSVTAKAYPGYNLISWQPVANAFKYEVYRYEDGNVTDTYLTTVDAGDALFTEDNEDLQNNVSYTYKVLAVGGNLNDHSAARAVIAKDSDAGTASVKAIVPPMGTSALNLAAYEGGYDGKNVKTLNDGEKKNYLLDADSTDIASALAQVAVAIRAKAYLDYDVYLDYGDKYSVEKKLLAADKKTLGSNSTIVNNTILPIRAAVSKAGEFAVYVEVSSKSPYYVNKDVVKVGTVKYDLLEAKTDPTVSVEYIDLGATARVTFTGVEFANGLKSTASNFVVYRTDDTASGYTAVTGEIKEQSAGSNTYFVDDAIEDNTKDYQYVVVLTDGVAENPKYGAAAAAADLGAYTKASAGAAEISATQLTLDTDNLADDIKWTVTLPNTKTTFKAYVLTKDENVKPNETGTTPVTTRAVAAEFDTTTALTAVAEADTTGKVWTIYTKNVGVGNTYLLVVTSEENKKDTYKVSNAVTVTVATVSAPTLTAKVYDNTVTGASTATAKLNDVIINVTDTINVVSDSIDNYTYTLYRTTSTVKDDITDGSITFAINTANWTQVGTTAVEMNANNDYNDAATSRTYVGVVKQEDLADGVYAYKVVKTNKAGVSKTNTTIAYVTITAIDDVNKIKYTPTTLSSAWEDASKATSKVTVKFVKNNTTNSPIRQKHTVGGVEEERIVGYVSETAEEDVKYYIYRTDKSVSSNMTDVVYHKLGEVTSKETKSSSEMTVYKWNTTASDWDTVSDYTYVDSITYSYEDTNLSTGDGYSYIIVGKKAGVADVISTSTSVTGAN